MRQRSISAIGVVIVALVPAFMGGPVFAVVLTALCLIGIHEYNAMANRLGNEILPTGFVGVAMFGLVAALGGTEMALFGACAIAAGAPLILAIFRADLNNAFLDWTLTASGTFYLGLPLFAAIALRQMEGSTDADWLNDLAGTLSFGWAGHARGLAWFLLAILVTWSSDTGAYLVGRTTGKHRLIPRISPNKTVEGLAGGLGTAAVTGALTVALFGLDIPWWAGLLLGLAIGVIGVIGDLAESLLKRQAGVKDSGSLIPGHGGMLDRLDALLFTWPAVWFFADLMEHWF